MQVLGVARLYPPHRYSHSTGIGFMVPGIAFQDRVLHAISRCSSAASWGMHSQDCAGFWHISQTFPLSARKTRLRLHLSQTPRTYHLLTFTPPPHFGQRSYYGFTTDFQLRSWPSPKKL